MATHSSILVWEIPWTEKPGRLHSPWGLKRIRHSLATKQQICCCCCQIASVVSDSVRPHRRQPTRPRRPWDSPGKNTGVGCHFLLQRMKVKSESEVAQLCPTLSDPMDYSPPGSSVHGIFPGKSTGVGCHCLLLQRQITQANIPDERRCKTPQQNTSKPNSTVH